MAPEPLTIAEVERIARSVIGDGDVVVRGSLHGYGNQSWRVDEVGGRSWVLKVGSLASAPKWRSAHQALALAADVGVPVPDLLYDAPHGDHLVRLFRWVDGTIAKGVALDPGQERRFATSLGRAVAALHQVRLSGFSSRLDGSAESFARWGDYLAHRFEEVRARCEATGAVDPATLDRSASTLDQLVGAIDDVAEPVLCHRDLHPANLVLAADGSLAGIIDWDMAEPWDRAGDWFKLEYEVLRTRPHLAADLVGAYLDGGSTPARWEERRAAVRLIETLNVLPNAVTQGWSDEYAERARSHLERLLADHDPGPFVPPDQ